MRQGEAGAGRQRSRCSQIPPGWRRAPLLDRPVAGARGRRRGDERGRGRHDGRVPAVFRGDRVKLLYFAWLRARIGCAEEETDLPPGVKDVAGLLDWLRSRGGGYAEALRDLSVVRVAVNQNYVGLDDPLRESDEIPVVPPPTGALRPD